jgi:hypothetical protein
MEFNKNWTKEDNDLMRSFIKEGKSVSDIVEYFGNDKLFYHPNKKHYHSNYSCLPNFNIFYLTKAQKMLSIFS